MKWETDTNLTIFDHKMLDNQKKHKLNFWHHYILLGTYFLLGIYQY